MENISEYLNTMLSVNKQMDITEAVTFAGRLYPKFGNVVILAGGAGSGKGYVKDKLLGIDGVTFDVDHIKKLSIKSKKISQKVKDELGYDLSKLDLKKPEDVGTLHEIIGVEMGLPKKQQKAFQASVLAAHPDRKPNIIFDVTLKDLQKLQSITSMVKKLGYDSKKIHIVWIVNDIEVAKKQNSTRDRVVPKEILLNTHRGVSLTMQDITKSMGTSLKDYMDGDIHFVFNKKDFDITKKKNKRGFEYDESGIHLQVKKSGKPIDTDTLTQKIIDKINLYTPTSSQW